MKKIVKLSIATGLGLLAGTIAYRLVKDAKETKYMKEALKDEFIEEPDKEEQFQKRHYIKIK